jgi:hypothetical protein
MKQKYLRKLKLLSETIWEKKVSKSKIDKWLDNFMEDEKSDALYLLTQFIYFSEFSVEKLLESLYRDLFKYNLISEIRKRNNDTLDACLINNEFKRMRAKSRFVSLGNPSESSSALMYLMRTVNKLPKGLFVSESDILNIEEDIENFIYIDDLCGSGSQAISYSEKFLNKIKEKFPDAKIWYLMLISTRHGKARIIKESDFNYVDSIFELDDSYKCFSENSRIFSNADETVDRVNIKQFSGTYGKKLMSSIIKDIDPQISPENLDYAAESCKHGYGNGQLLLGFHHNTPDNSLPIIWYNENHENWKPIFKRHNKIYGT